MTSGRRAGCATAICSRCWRALAARRGASLRRAAPLLAAARGAAARLRRRACACSASCRARRRARPPGGAAARLGGQRRLLYVLSLAAAAVRARLRRAAPEPARSRRDPSPQSGPVPLLPPARGGRRGARHAAALSGPAAVPGRLLARRQLHAAGRGAGGRRAAAASPRSIAVSPVLDPGATLVALRAAAFPATSSTSCASGCARCCKKQAAWPDAYDFGALGAAARPAAHDRGAGARPSPSFRPR